MHSSTTWPVLCATFFSLLCCVYDKIGDDIKIERAEEAIIRTKVLVLNVFLGLVFRYEGKIMDEGPKKVSEAYYNMFWECIPGQELK